MVRQFPTEAQRVERRHRAREILEASMNDEPCPVAITHDTILGLAQEVDMLRAELLEVCDHLAEKKR